MKTTACKIIFAAGPGHARPLMMAVALGWVVLFAGRGVLCAGNLYLPNASFETPFADYPPYYAIPYLDEWQKSAPAAAYDPATNYNTPWEDLSGTFYNANLTNSSPNTFIDNCDGTQAAFLFALSGVGFFQDYNSIGNTSGAPDHAFNAKFNVGRSYNLTVGVIGGGGGMNSNAVLQLSLYYRDASSSIVIVASTTVTNSTNLFPSTTNFVDCQAHVPAVQSGDAWAGQNIGVQLCCTVGSPGYWDVDNVRLTEEIDVPNFSFETRFADYPPYYAIPHMDEWQKTAQPAAYDPATNYNTPWEDLSGTFYNANLTNSSPNTFIDNCDGVQAAFIFALADAGFFQDYNSTGDTSATPSHAFAAKFTPGKAYALAVGVIGGGGGMNPGAVLQLSLYYRDPSSNMVTVAATSVTNTSANFPTTTHLVDFQVQIPNVKATDPWAGQYIGIQLLSTVASPGYWDVDNVRLTEVVAPNLQNPVLAGGQFNLALQSDPGTTWEILGTTNVSLPLSSWTSVATLTNVTGTIPFSDPATGLNRRFYGARQLP